MVEVVKSTSWRQLASRNKSGPLLVSLPYDTEQTSQTPCQICKFILAFCQPFSTPGKAFGFLRQCLDRALRVEHRHEVLVAASEQRHKHLHRTCTRQITTNWRTGMHWIVHGREPH